MPVNFSLQYLIEQKRVNGRNKLDFERYPGEMETCNKEDTASDNAASNILCSGYFHK